MVKRKKLLSQSQRMRTSMKMAFIIGAGSISGLVVLLLIVFNVSKREVSHAGTAISMEFVNAEAFQDTSSVFRGSRIRPVIGVLIEMRGNTNPVKVNSLTFNLNGTTRPIAKNVENARLFYTGNSKSYNDKMQTGNTISILPEGEFKIDAARILQPGKNFFWLTLDVKSTATPNGSLDAELVSLSVGNNTFLPLISAPMGEKQIRNNNSFYSTGSNKDISKPESWNTQPDGKGTAPANMCDAKNCFIIQSGHQAYANEVAQLPNVVIESGAKLTAAENARITELHVSYNGTYLLDVAANDCACINKLVMEDGANYIHNSTGIFAAAKAVLSKSSNVIFNQYDEKTFARNIKWGNVIIDAEKSLNVNIVGSFGNVQGNFEIKSTAGNDLYVEGTDVINVQGNFTVSGGIFEGVRGSNSRLTLNIGNNFIVTGGQVQDVENNYTANAGTIINVGGNVQLMAGIIDLSNAQAAKSELNLTGKENRIVHWIQKPKANVALCNVSVKPSKEVYLDGEKLGDIAKGKILTVESGAALWCASYAVTGEGRFVLSDKATLGIASSRGLNSSGSEGNILTETRTFNSGANYVYYGRASQQTGVFSTTPENGSVRNLIVQKDAEKQTVALLQNIYVMERVNVSRGEINKGKYNIEMSDMAEVAVNTGK